MQRLSPPPQPAFSLRGSHLFSRSLDLPVERRESERSHIPVQPLQHAEMAMRSTTPGSRSSPVPALAPPPLPLAQHDPSSIHSCSRQAAKPSRCSQEGPERLAGCHLLLPCRAHQVAALLQPWTSPEPTAREKKGRNCMGEGKRIKVRGATVKTFVS